MERVDEKKKESKFKRICVFCGSSPGNKNSYKDAAIHLGTQLVARDIDLVYGGGSIGLMGLVSQAVYNGGRHVIGIIPKILMPREITGETVGEVRTVADMHQRKAEMSKLSDAFIALPGGYGTLEELLEVIAWAQLGIHDKPVGLLNVDGYYNLLLSFVDKAVEEGFIFPTARNILISAPTPNDLLNKLEVPLFDQMDERMLDAICERLKPALCTQGTCLVREGDPVNEMLFIIRGNLDSYTTNGGRTGFLNSCRIGPGDFCGEELLTWALDPRPSVIIPSSTRTVKAISEMEPFALIAEDLKFVASQFRRLHSKQLRHKFRFYSHQWRTWAACFVQAAWRRYKRRKNAATLKAMERHASFDSQGSFDRYSDVNVGLPGPGFVGPGFAAYGARMGKSTRRGGSGGNTAGSNSGVVNTLQKPEEPDFSVDEE